MSAARLEQRLRAALSGSSEHGRRPLVDLELPFLVQKALLPTLSLLRPAAVLVPVLRRPDGLTVLLTRRAETLRSHKGQISFPGGRRDDEDLSLAACALREAQEEVGLPLANSEVIGYLDDYPTITRYRVTPVVALVTPPERFLTDPGEVAEIFEVPLSHLLSADAYERKAFTRSGLNVPFFEINHGPWRIWGATAGMLWNLCRKVAQAAEVDPKTD